MQVIDQNVIRCIILQENIYSIYNQGPYVEVLEYNGNHKRVFF